MILSAKKWFKEFVDILPSDDGVKALDELFDERGSYGSDLQWTHVMSVFLMKLARKMGYFQVCGRIDFVWYEGDSVNESILIEHENDYKGAIESELPKLLQHKSKKDILRVLITYTWTDKPSSSDKIKQTRNIILGGVCAKIKKSRWSWKGEFLLIIGDSSPDEGHIPWDKYWHGYIFDKSGRHKNLNSLSVHG